MAVDLRNTKQLEQKLKRHSNTSIAPNDLRHELGRRDNLNSIADMKTGILKSHGKTRWSTWVILLFTLIGLVFSAISCYQSVFGS